MYITPLLGVVHISLDTDSGYLYEHLIMIYMDVGSGREEGHHILRGAEVLKRGSYLAHKIYEYPQ